jgi:DNA-binding IclR family transcriptional regulator
MYSQIGNRAPLHCTGVGKAVLAFLPEEQREALLNGGDLQRYTDNTLTDPDVLRAHLAQIRAQGFAIDNGEHEEHVRCIAAPLFARTGQVVGAISIAAVSYRVNLPTLLSWQPMLSERAHQLNAELAHYFDRYA